MSKTCNGRRELKSASLVIFSQKFYQHKHKLPGKKMTEYINYS